MAKAANHSYHTGLVINFYSNPFSPTVGATKKLRDTVRLGGAQAESGPRAFSLQNLSLGIKHYLQDC